jgi:hypothetical protein
MRFLRRVAYLAAIVVAVGLAGAIGLAIVDHGASFGLGTALGCLLTFLFALIHPSR